jgi:predicted RNase H-like nuclease (RuvC/YqgF family)
MTTNKHNLQTRADNVRQALDLLIDNLLNHIDEQAEARQKLKDEVRELKATMREQKEIIKHLRSVADDLRQKA